MDDDTVLCHTGDALLETVRPRAPSPSARPYRRKFTVFDKTYVLPEHRTKHLAQLNSLPGSELLEFIGSLLPTAATASCAPLNAGRQSFLARWSPKGPTNTLRSYTPLP